jgi:hypothetical protein
MSYTGYIAQSVPRIARFLEAAFDALVTGSRTIPMGDNGAVLRDLAARRGEPRAGGRRPPRRAPARITDQ